MTLPQRLLLAVVAIGVLAAGCLAAEAPDYRRSRDVIYRRQLGYALTMDVFTPDQNHNGAAVVMVMSGGWISSHRMINPELFATLLERGYTVFAVVHGSQPKFTIPEIMGDMHRSVRFIRYHAADYGIDPNRIGISGSSAGGHLSLMIGTSGFKTKADEKDPIDRQSSRVQAVACFFPPTDFLNYGERGRDVFQALEAELNPFKAPFDFVELDRKNRRLVQIEDRQRRLDIAREISPITHVTPDDPPTLIIHGDADKLVPIQQAEMMQRRLEAAGVPVRLVVKKGEGHGWSDWIADMTLIADFFDEYLLARPIATRPE